MSNHSLPINISVYENNKEKINNADNSYQEYIIQNNEFINNRNKEYIIQIKDIQNDLDTIEDENDKLEKRITYMRGFLHNSNQIIKAKEKYIKLFFNYHKNIYEYTNVLNKNILIFIKSLYLLFSLFYIILVSFWIFGSINFFIIIYNTIFLILASVISILYYNVNIKYYIDFDNTVNSFNISTLEGKKQIDFESNKIKELISSNDNISEYIDIM